MYYIYIYLDPLKPGVFIYQDLIFNYEPFYVGRGKNNRYFVHCQPHKLKNKNEKNEKIKFILSKNLNPIINFPITGITFDESLNIEREIISKIGRIKLNSGPLTNLTAGGQGVVGMIISDETKEKIKATCIKRGVYKRLSENMKGDKNVMSGEKWHRTKEGEIGYKEKMKDFSIYKNKTEEEIKIIKNKISKTLTGYEWNDVEKEKRRLGMKKVWNERKEKNISVNNFCVNVKITDIVTNEQIIFRTRKEAAQYLNITPMTVSNRSKKNIIKNNKKIEFLKNN